MTAAVQLNLDLAHQLGGRAGSSWSIALTDEALIVENPGRVRIALGCWSRLFGCWVSDFVRARVREVVPAWRPVEADGVSWPHGLGPSWGPAGRPGALSPRLSFQYRAALTAYLAEIPAPLRAVVRGFGPWQWTALDLIWQWPAFATFLDKATFHGRRQYVFAALALARARRLRRRERETLARRLASEPPARLLSSLSGMQWTDADVRALCGLGPDPRPRAVYAALPSITTRLASSWVPAVAESMVTGLVT